MKPRYRVRRRLDGWEVRDYGQKPNANHSVHPTQASAKELAERLKPEGGGSQMSNRLAYVLGFIALVFVFLPHWLDPLILLKEKREGWEQRPERPRSRLSIVIALVMAVTFAAVAAAGLWFGMSLSCGPCDYAGPP